MLFHPLILHVIHLLQWFPNLMGLISLPIITEEEQTHEENLPNMENPHNNPSAQSDHSNICESSSNLPISNETPIHSREDVHHVSPIILAEGLNVTIKTQEIQSTI
ncbi:hypothetical protein O181_002888 [Austropuccinia psidii MF-1]|uniref:Uncharacterized protein n=1 Tax=Austropuccinia psidii MF-1 TaxID=1389203 RepID=A0A9Q3BDD1_9BASI|nr:hypothetical protein [Austropuccinia psidii MF-1]